ncbi:MAG: low affinity iron permease family protein [Burkholderiaceae bacterium]|nr:low affinity iron permease family protein [Burkholderiaceae bacterium]
MNASTRGERQRDTRAARGRRRAYGVFERFAALATRASGSSTGFVLAALVVVVWAISGPLFGFSQTWQLVINTGTTIVTFLMVFLIQHSQNKDSRAVHLKLNELLASHEYASNRLVAIEDLDEDSLRKLHDFYCRLAELAEQEGGLKVSHSVDEAAQVHSRKKRARQARADGQPRRKAVGSAEDSSEVMRVAAKAARDTSEAARDTSESVREVSDVARRISDEAREAAAVAVEAADATRRENGAHGHGGSDARSEKT